MKNKIFLKVSPMKFSLLLNIIFLLTFFIFASIKYEVSDDFIMQLLVSGGYTGIPSEEIMFMDLTIGHILSSLYKLIPYINWYFWMHIGIIFTSLTSITFICVKRRNSLLMKTMVFVFLCFFSNDLYLLVQFTKTATISLLASFILLLEFCERKSSYKILLASFFMFYFGIAARYNSYLVVLPYVMLLLLVYLVKKHQEKCLYQTSRKLVVALLGVFMIMFSLGGFKEMYINNHEEYKTYTAFNSLRGKILDYPYYSYDELKTGFQKVGYSESDYINLVHGNYIDNEVYTEEKLDDIYNYLSEYRSSHPLGKRDSIRKLIERDYYKYISLIGCFILFILGSLKYRYYLLIAFLGFGGTLIILFLYAYMGRIVYRVEYSTFLSLGAILLYLPILLEQKEIIKESIFKRMLVMLSVAMLIMRIPLYIKDYDNAYHIMFFSGDNDLKKYRSSFGKSNRQNDLIKEFKNHPENLYFLSYQTSLQSYYLNFSPFTSGVQIPFENVIYLSGVETNHPEWKKALKRHNIENPAKALVRDNVYVVDNVSDEEILTLLSEHSNSKIIKELYKKLDGSEIWKYTDINKENRR